MLNLLRADLYKLWKTKVFRICLILSVALVIFTACSGLYATAIFKNMTPKMIEEFNNGFGTNSGFRLGLSNINTDASLSEMLDEISHYNGLTFAVTCLTGNIASVFMAIFIAFFIGGEFSNRTFCHSVSRGFRRRDIYISKMIISAIGSVIFLGVIFTSSLITGSLLWGFQITAYTLSTTLYTLLMQILLHIGLSAVFTLTAMSSKSSGFAIGLNFILLIFMPVILSLLNMIVSIPIFDLNILWIGEAIHLFNLNYFQLITCLQIGLLSLSYIFLTTLIGAYFFQTKDIQ